MIAASALLIVLFQGHIERRFDADITANMQDLIAAADVGSNGSLRMDWNPIDPRYRQPLSGWYWQVSSAGIMLARSASSDQSATAPLVAADPGTSGAVRWHEFTGPKDATLRAMTRSIRLPDSNRTFDFLVSGPKTNITADVREFGQQLLITMGLLALGLVAAMVFQVRFGLRPLRLLRANLAEVRSGDRQRLPDLYPSEMRPLVSEVNKLLDHNESIIEQARVQGANLAHAIKNPLSVIHNEAGKMTDHRGEVVREQVSQLRQSVDRHLSRFRSAGAGRSPNARTSVGNVVSDLVFSMETIHQGRSLDIGRENVDGLYFRGERDDLEEMLGNLLDNACKWARSTVMIRGEHVGESIRIFVEDDGPGIPLEQREEVFKPGRRLDESVHGTGLGLAIVRDMVGMYRGEISFHASASGGTRATLVLPAVAVT